MRLSVFNLYVEDYPEPGSTLVHNTFSGSYVVLDDETLSALRKLDAGEPLTADERELTADPDFVDPDVAILVESHESEEAEFQDWFRLERANTHTLSCIVGLNLACNFDCPYCCQAGVMDGSVMSLDTCDAAADWLAQRAISVGVEAVRPVFVGGEPLLHVDRLLRIADRIRTALDSHGIDFGFNLITNGYLLTPDVTARLKRAGLLTVEVTMDGDESTHSRTRVSKKGEDTFPRIFANTVAASRMVRVRLNGNYRADTVHGFIPLLKKLREADIDSNTVVRFTPALEALDAPAGGAGGACSWGGADTSHHVAIQDEVLRSGFKRSPMHAVGPCMFHDHEGYAIDTDGSLLKCPGFLGHPEWAIGHVTSGLTDRYQRSLDLTFDNECGGCAHRPNCAGGCVADEWLRNGEMGGVNCERDYFDQIKGDSLVREYLLATSETTEDAVMQFPQSPQPIPSGSQRRSGVRPPGLRVVSA